jgi:hypothetical protein
MSGWRDTIAGQPTISFNSSLEYQGTTEPAHGKFNSVAVEKEAEETM